MQTQQSTNSRENVIPRGPARPVFTVKQFSGRNPAWSEPALRNLIFKADTRHSSRGEIPGNGLIEAGAIVRIGRKVLIDEDAFFAWVDAQKGTPCPSVRA